MKMLKIFAAAGLVVAAMGVSVSADAQARHHNNGGHHGWHGNRGHHGWHGGRGHGWGRHHGGCRTVIRHHHRVRVCR